MGDRMNDRMNRPVAVLISSYERVDGLSRLLEALDRQRLGPIAADRVKIIVVDNSAGRTAEAACAVFAARSRFGLTYVAEDRKGLTYARNASLQAAWDMDAAFGAFIDDDELPAPDWLASLYEALAPSDAVAAMGPVYPVFQYAPPAWSVKGEFFSKTLTPVAGSLEDGYTSNALLSLDFLRDHGLAFDPRCNLSGGEDTLLFSQVRRRNGIIIWAERARVYESIPPDRMSRAWVIRRWFRTGGTIVDCHAMPSRWFSGRLELSLEGAARVVYGVFDLAFTLMRHPSRSERHLAALFTLCRGAGLLAATVGRRHLEYASQEGAGGSGAGVSR